MSKPNLQMRLPTPEQIAKYEAMRAEHQANFDRLEQERLAIKKRLADWRAQREQNKKK
jgi:hypothetical protein